MHSYLTKIDGAVIERPQYMYMRTAIAVHHLDLAAILETYDALSRQIYTHASPTLFNAGVRGGSFASCFLYQPKADSVASLLDSAFDLDKFWMADGGVGLSLASVPCQRLVCAPHIDICR